MITQVHMIYAVKKTTESSKILNFNFRRFTSSPFSWLLHYFNIIIFKYLFNVGKRQHRVAVFVHLCLMYFDLVMDSYSKHIYCFFFSH